MVVQMVWKEGDESGWTTIGIPSMKDFYRFYSSLNHHCPEQFLGSGIHSINVGEVKQ